MTFVGRKGKRKIHIVSHTMQAHHEPKIGLGFTACGVNRSRRYVGGWNWTRSKVNCRECLLALVESLTFSEFVEHLSDRRSP